MLAAAQGRLAAAGEWVLNEKRLAQRAGLAGVQDLLAGHGPSLGPLVARVDAALDLSDPIWS